MYRSHGVNDSIASSLCACVPQDSPNPRGVMSSKASGEPSLMMSTSVLTALQNAVAAGRREVGAPGLGDVDHQVGLVFTVVQFKSTRTFDFVGGVCLRERSVVPEGM